MQENYYAVLFVQIVSRNALTVDANINDELKNVPKLLRKAVISNRRRMRDVQKLR